MTKKKRSKSNTFNTVTLRVSSLRWVYDGNLTPMADDQFKAGESPDEAFLSSKELNSIVERLTAVVIAKFRKTWVELAPDLCSHQDICVELRYEMIDSSDKPENTNPDSCVKVQLCFDPTGKELPAIYTEILRTIGDLSLKLDQAICV